MLTSEALEDFEELIAELKEQALAGVPIIVEGTDDVRTLKRLGIEGRFHKISSGRSVLNFIEGLSGAKEAIILTDFDRTGERLAKFCAKHLKQLGVEPITEIREKIGALVHKEVKDIEGLAKFLENQRTTSRD